MIARTPERALTADAAEFVRFCYRQRRVGWPELYDEMCAAASRGSFRGWGAPELEAHGIGFGLADLPALAGLVRQVLLEEAEHRGRPGPAIVTVAPPTQTEPASPDRSSERPAATVDGRPAYAARAVPA